MDEDTDAPLPVHRAETAHGRVLITPEGEHPYKVVFMIGDQLLSEQPVPTVREGERLIRAEIADIQFTARQQRPDPSAPPKRLEAIS